MSGPKSPLPWERMPYSGSTDSWIKDADGKDICRISAGGHVVAIHDRDAEFIVQAVNATLVKDPPDFTDYERIVRDTIDALREAGYGATPGSLATKVGVIAKRDAEARALPDNPFAFKPAPRELDGTPTDRIIAMAHALGYDVLDRADNTFQLFSIRGRDKQWKPVGPAVDIISLGQFCIEKADAKVASERDAAERHQQGLKEALRVRAMLKGNGAIDAPAPAAVHSPADIDGPGGARTPRGPDNGKGGR